MPTFEDIARVFREELYETRGFVRKIAIRLFCGAHELAPAVICQRAVDLPVSRRGRTALPLGEHASSLLADR